MNSIKSKYKVSYFVLLATLLASGMAFGQSQLQQGDYEYTKEVTWGINKNTNGGIIGGVVFKLGFERSKDNYEIFGVELSNVKHPQELSFSRQNRFIWGKSNYLYAVRLQYGRERILFRKAPQQGVQISAGATIGPSIGVITPYYVQLGSIGAGAFNQEFAPFDPDEHTFDEVIGSGRLFQGLPESSFAIGANAKGFINFEFGAFKNNVAGLEVGLLVEAYNREIIIIPTQENRAVYNSAYFTLYWGSRK